MRIKGNFSSTFCEANQAVLSVFRQFELGGLAADPGMKLKNQFALREAFNNAVEHGNGMVPFRKVSYDIRMTRQLFQAEIRDDGPGFDLARTIEREQSGACDRERSRGLVTLSDMGFVMASSPGCFRLSCAESNETPVESNADPAAGVLIVDDSDLNRKLLRALLRSIDGIRLLDAHNGEEALALLAANPVSVVILDVMMPGLNGLQVLARIKESPMLQHVSIIMCTALSEIGMVEDALRLGALDYFTKPMSEDQMRITLPLKVRNAMVHYENQASLVRFQERTKTDMQLAARLQEYLTADSRDYGTVRAWGRYIPSEDVGGDMYCTREYAGSIWFMMADVSGHGLVPSIFSTMLGVLFDLAVELCADPKTLLQYMNEKLNRVLNQTNNGFVSAFAGCLTGETLLFANAGHPYPYLCEAATGTVRELEIGGFLLGMFEQVRYEQGEVSMQAGDLLLLYTDGLFDNGSPGAFSNWHAIGDYCADHMTEVLEDPPLFADNLLDHFSGEGGHVFRDDVAVLMLQRI